jgi:hypothetical protein
MENSSLQDLFPCIENSVVWFSFLITEIRQTVKLEYYNQILNFLLGLCRYDDNMDALPSCWPIFCTKKSKSTKLKGRVWRFSQWYQYEP